MSLCSEARHWKQEAEVSLRERDELSRTLRDLRRENADLREENARLRRQPNVSDERLYQRDPGRAYQGEK